MRIGNIYMRPFTFIILNLFLTVATYGQSSKIIKGIATDKAGNPIPFCNVSIKGIKTAATTNSCGEFELATGKGDYSIVFSCMSTHGFATFERRVKQEDIHDGDTVIFQLNKHGKTPNKECKKVNKDLQKLIVN